MPDVSVAICTYNRAAMLADTLASFASQHARCHARFELLVVDNNSRDGTADVVAAFASANPHIPTRCVRETRQGLSHARNRAAAEATGEVIAYCDDDVFFDSDIVDAYAEAFGRDANLVAAAGRIDAHFEGSRPPWLTDALLAPYSVTAYGDSPRPLTAREYPVGANMAFRRAQLLAHGGFNARLGRDGKSLLSNEESLVVWMLRQQGGSLVYLPAARVRHRIPTDRLTVNWLLSRLYWQGISDALSERQMASVSRAAALRGVLGDLRIVLRTMRAKTLNPRTWYWHVLQPGVATGTRRAYFWGRARGRFNEAFRPSPK